MNDFQQLVEGINPGRAVYFDSLDFDTQCALVGKYILGNYGAPNEMEPLVESMAPPPDMVADIPTALYGWMGDGEPSKEILAVWGRIVVEALVKNYSGLVQSAIDDVLNRAGTDYDRI